ncbi:MAG: hypothetical protein HY042_10165, partial [Spirochaetia bacterium]|nr:hypothetical protein [Spirochaetia bacterium]
MLPIESLNHKFEGEFHFHRRRYSVPFLLPGDQVQFQLVRQGGRLRVKVHRTEKVPQPPGGVPTASPFCPAFARCGGCKAQHIQYDEQVRIKARPVLLAMEKAYSITPEILHAPLTSGFRNRMDFVIQGDCIGLRGSGDFTLFVDLEECAVQ